MLSEFLAFRVKKVEPLLKKGKQELKRCFNKEVKDKQKKVHLRNTVC